MMTNTIKHFGLVSKILHWSMALLLFVLFAIGLYMTSLDYYDPLYHRLPEWHKSLGLFTMMLLLLRIIWKIINPSPAALTNHQYWEIFLAKLIQLLFYFLILLIGISGYLISTAKGKGIEFFNLFEIPAITQALEEGRTDFIGEIHELLAITLITLAVLHATAALKHHFIDKDETLKRMINQ